MSPRLQRFLGALGAVGISAAVNLATGFLTEHKALKWWISGIALLVVGVLIQCWLPAGRPSVSGAKQGIDGTTVGGSVNQTMSTTGVQTVANGRITGDIIQEQTK